MRRSFSGGCDNALFLRGLSCDHACPALLSSLSLLALTPLPGETPINLGPRPSRLGPFIRPEISIVSSPPVPFLSRWKRSPFELGKAAQSYKTPPRSLCSASGSIVKPTVSAEQSSEALNHPAGDTMHAKRDCALLAMLFGGGFRRSELVVLELDHIQMRQGHWAVVDLIGKVAHIRVVPIPNWVKVALDQGTRVAGVCEGKIFRAVARSANCERHTSRLYSSGSDAV